MRKSVHFAFIIFAIILVLLLFVVGFWFFMGRESKINKGGAYSPYPYTWQRQEDNQIQFILEQDSESPYKWVPKEVPGHLIRISDAVPLENNNKKAVFTITPLEVGAESFVFAYCKEGEIPDELYAFEVFISVDENNCPNITAVTGTALTGIQTLTHETSGTYLTSVDHTNTLWIGHTNLKGSFVWQLQEADETVLIEYPELQGQAAIMAFRGVKAGETTVKLFGKRYGGDGTDVILTIPVTVDEALHISVKPIELTEEAAPILETESEAENQKKMETLLDCKISLPAEAVRRRYTNDSYMEENGKEHSFGQVFFSYEQRNWCLNIMKDTTVSTMQKLLDFPNVEGNDFTIGTTTGKLYENDSGLEAFWETAEGFSYSLSGRRVTKESLDKLIEAVME